MTTPSHLKAELVFQAPLDVCLNFVPREGDLNITLRCTALNIGSGGMLKEYQLVTKFSMKLTEKVSFKSYVCYLWFNPYRGSQQ